MKLIFWFEISAHLQARLQSTASETKKFRFDEVTDLAQGHTAHRSHRTEGLPVPALFSESARGRTQGSPMAPRNGWGTPALPSSLRRADTLDSDYSDGQTCAYTDE